MTLASNDDGELFALRALSAALGADPLRTQGAGGNISIKRDGILWIKASGTWLADALAHDIMTPVRLEPLREAIARRDPRAAAAVDFVDSDLNASGLRPSIETSVHAVIPSPVVVHIHCVNTIALAVRRDGEALVHERLGRQADVVSAFVPYRKPGLPLAIAVSERSTTGTNVFVLANHGLVVAGGTVAEVADRTARVCEAFSAPARPAPELERRGAFLDRRANRVSAAAGVSRARRRARSEKSGDRKPRIALSRSRGLSRARPRHGDDAWRAPRGACGSPAIADAGLAGSWNRASSFSDEERGRDGAMSCGCCGSHPRRRPDDCPDRRRRARIDELGSRDLPTVDRQMSLSPDACMRYRN